MSKEVQNLLARRALSLFVTALRAALRVLPKYDVLQPTHAERLQGALEAVDVREDVVRAPSAQGYEYALGLVKA